MTSAACFVAGKRVASGNQLVVRSPYTRETVGTVELAGRADVEAAIVAALAPAEPLTRAARAEVLDKTRSLLANQREEFARLITSESGLCIRDTRYEVGRALDVLRSG